MLNTTSLLLPARGDRGSRQRAVTIRVNAPTISVVIPNRNDARFLKRCLDSVLAQADPPDEVIVLDDESTDDSVAVIERAIAGHPVARLVRNPRNLGATENSNKGLELARCEYVHFLGANDFVLPGIYAAARASLREHPTAGIWSAMVWAVDEEDRFLRVHRSPVLSLAPTFLAPRRVRDLIYRQGNWLTGQTAIYRREPLVALGGFDPGLFALTDLVTAHVLASRHGACFVPSPLAGMRLHKGSFLADTVTQERVFLEVLDRVEREGRRIEPELFREDMVRRTRQRLRYSSLRAALAAEPDSARRRMSREPEASIRILARCLGLLPAPLIAALLALALRPYDIGPALWYRIGGGVLVALRVRVP